MTPPMELPARESVPLPALVDDWVDEQCQAQGITFRDLAVQALKTLRASLGEHCASGTPTDANLATWLDAETAAYGTGAADRITEAVCTLWAERTGIDLAVMLDSGWRRLRPSQRQAAALERILAGSRRHGDALWQMRERSGPLYDRAKERSRIISAAWRAAGRPARVIRVRHGRDGIAWYLYAPRKRGQRQEVATPEQVAAWAAWQRERARLYREMGWDR